MKGYIPKYNLASCSRRILRPDTTDIRSVFHVLVFLKLVRLCKLTAERGVLTLILRFFLIQTFHPDQESVQLKYSKG